MEEDQGQDELKTRDERRRVPRGVGDIVVQLCRRRTGKAGEEEMTVEGRTGEMRSSRASARGVSLVPRPSRSPRQPQQRRRECRHRAERTETKPNLRTQTDKSYNDESDRSPPLRILDHLDLLLHVASVLVSRRRRRELGGIHERASVAELGGAGDLAAVGKPEVKTEKGARRRKGGGGATG